MKRSNVRVSGIIHGADLNYCSVGKFESVVGIFHH